MPRIHWKPILLVFVMAVGLRGLLWWKAPPADTAGTAPLTLTHVEEVGEDAEEGSTVNEDAPSHGALTFEKDPVPVNPRPEDDEVMSTFSFTNTSDRPITITNLDSTCSCLETELDQRTYAPGAKGTGKALFKVSSLVGPHEKTLHLFTDHPEFPEQVLTFILDVPAVISIEPNILEWTVGEPVSTKEFVIKMVGKDPMKITKLSASRENVTYELKEITPGREFRLSMTPKTTDDVTYGFLKLETDSKIPKYAQQMAFFSILRPDLAAKKQAAREANAK